jgi:hypothetical protein
MSSPANIPPPSPCLHALGHLACALEKEIPGLMDAWVESLEDEAIQREIIRIRAPREAPEAAQARMEALEWVRLVRLVTLASMGRRKRRKA